MNAKQSYVPKNKYYLDMTTGFVKAGTQVIETDERYKNRFIPWTAEIPKSGRVDLKAFQQQLSEKAGKSADEIAEHEEFLKWKAGKATPTSTVTASVVPETGKAEVKEIADQQKDKKSEEQSDPFALSAEQRKAKIMAVMTDLTVDDMTKSQNPMPTVFALNRRTELTDIEGPEREAIFEEFKKANKDWQPKAK